MPERLLTARNVADTIGVHVETILRYTRDGKLPAIRLPGGAIRFRASEVDRWLDEQTVGGRVREGVRAT